MQTTCLSSGSWGCLGLLLLVTPAVAAQTTPAAVPPPPTATAQRVAVARLTFEGVIPEGLQDLFAQRLVQGLSAARFEVLRGTDVQQRLVGPNQPLASCQNAACYPAMAYVLGASYLITAHVAESNKTYTMVMEIINGRTGAVLASNRERCETCGVEEAGEKMGLAASALRERLEAVSRDPARIIIRSRPAGAAVVLDGRQTGVTPLDVELRGGPHHAQLYLANHDPLSRSFTVVGGVDEALDLDLVALPSKFPYRAAGWSALAGGAALLVAGIVAMSVDNEEIGCSEADKDVNGHCPWIRSTNWWAASMIGLGVAAATTGGFFLYLAPSTATAPATAAAGVAGTF
ncbi:MAG: PEGA domain-containing protein [Deltaproteobacteria bacterium]|nr:PEGA domain-containing protein [Deltaproteobacteria bacterium]